VRFSVSAPSHHNPFSAAFTINIAESNFRHTQPESPMAVNGRLVGRMGFSFKRPIIVSPGELDAINHGIMNLYLVGYADYTDAFGHKYRSAFVRRFDPQGSDENLVFVNPSAHYEYDRPQKRGAWFG
jgi:hypothetical protein